MMSARFVWALIVSALALSCGNLATSEELGFTDDDTDTDTDTGCTSGS